MRIATWCIDGVCGRLEVLCHWLKRREPDVVALQKIRVSEEKFPAKALASVAYRSEPLRTESSYGVALLARNDLPKFEILDRGLPGGDRPDDRFLTARIGDLVVSSVYAPFGNPAVRGRDGAIKYKVAWLDRLIAHLEERRVDAGRSLLCGDFNVLPDVPAKPGVPNCTQDEKERLQTILKTGFQDLYDLYRRLHRPSAAGRNHGFNPRLPHTSRLQLTLGTESVAAVTASVRVDLEYRAAVDELPGRTWPASAPMIVDLADPA
ncbi:MAG: endonuclease/exonuclease/phosphatase family protein [Acidobacteriota bacterium]|nr:endonuclease/exonuclease/phosphatase family protein [Acidobacteriota bacterium]